MLINHKDLTVGSKVYAVSYERNIKPFYGLISYKNNLSYPDRCLYVNKINNKGVKLATSINIVTDSGYISCFTDEQESIDYWNNQINKHIDRLHREIEKCNQSRITKL
jgi:hypothetical protein